jgi:hypothetical protein
MPKSRSQKEKERAEGEAIKVERANLDVSFSAEPPKAQTAKELSDERSRALGEPIPDFGEGTVTEQRKRLLGDMD